MKYIRQFGIILIVSFFGEVLKYLLPFQVPASIYGLLIMFLALELHIIPLDSVRETSKFLIDIMPLMFIPAGVGLMNSWDVLRPICSSIIAIIIISTIIVMIISGRVTQFMIRYEKRKKIERDT